MWLASATPVVKYSPGPSGNPARLATSRITCNSTSTAAGAWKWTQILGFQERSGAMRSADSAANVGAGLTKFGGMRHLGCGGGEPVDHPIRQTRQFPWTVEADFSQLPKPDVG